MKNKKFAIDDPEMVESSVDKEILKTVTVGSHKKNLWKCNKCNSEYVSYFHNFKKGRRCPYCCSTPRKVNYTNWAYSDKEMFDSSVDKEILKTVTVGSEKKNTWRCNKCDNKYTSSFLNFNSGNRCPYCRGLKVNETNWSYSNKEMFEASVDKEILKTVTVNSGKKNKWLCEKCNSEYISAYYTFNTGIRCPYCCSAPRKVNKTNWAYNNKEMVGASIDKEILKNVTMKSNKNNKWKCYKCNSEYILPFSVFYIGCRCPYCSGHRVNETNWSYNNKEMFESSVDEEILKTVTENSNKKNMWKCKKCNNIYISMFCAFKMGDRCPKCNESKGEKIISKFLTDNKIDYKAQYRIKECKNEKPLPFDHAIFENNNLKGLIEFHGIQHEISVEHFAGDKGLEKRKNNDIIKEEYCLKNNIPFLVIWYYDKKNIINILSDFINKICERKLNLS